MIAVSIGVQAACERWFQCLCVRARSAQRETERARNFGDCVNEERRGEGGWGVGLNPR